MSTHSPAIIRSLPSAAIKVLIYDRMSKKIKLSGQESAPEEAFFHIGEPLSGKLLIVVEDILAKKVVMKALRRGGEAFLSRFDVRTYPGGASTLWGPLFADLLH